MENKTAEKRQPRMNTDGHGFHREHVRGGDDVAVAGGGDADNFNAADFWEKLSAG